MKKFIPVLLGLMWIVCSVQAVESVQNDTVIYFNKKEVHLEDSIGQIRVKVLGLDGGEYKPVYEGVFSDGKSYEKWTVLEEIGFQLPFINKVNIPKKKYSMEAHWAGIGWGFANISDEDMNINNINGLSLKSESSNEFYFNLIEKILPVYRNNFGLTTGLGFMWRNYFLDMNKHFVENDNVTEIEDAPVGIQYEYSRLRTFNITIPVLLEWQPTFGKNHKFFVSAGVVGGINTFASFKVKYEDGDRTIKNVEGKGMNVAPVSLDFLGQVGYGSWSVYAKYSPFGLFQSQKGPEVRPVSLGLMLNF